MPNPHLSDRPLDAVIAYILSVRGQNQAELRAPPRGRRISCAPMERCGAAQAEPPKGIVPETPPLQTVETRMDAEEAIGELITQRGRSAVTKQGRRTSLWHQRCTEGTKPTVRHLATLAVKQVSFSAQRSRETARRSRRRTVWRFARCSIGPLREAPNSFLLRVLERPPCFSVLKNLLPYFGPAATTQHRWVSAGQREGGCISRGDAQ
jgi:hypothetical protein